MANKVDERITVTRKMQIQRNDVVQGYTRYHYLHVSKYIYIYREQLPVNRYKTGVGFLVVTCGLV